MRNDKLLMWNVRVLLGIASLALLSRAAFAADEYKGKPWKDQRQEIPGKIIAAFYDVGGEGVAYHDLDKQNHGSGELNHGPAEKDNFRKDEGVDVSYTKAAFDKFADGKKPAMDVYYVGWTNEGEWMNYSVEVKEAGTYAVNMLASSNNKDAQISLAVNGVDKTGPITLESTGHWHTWKNYDKIAEITLEKGPQLLTFKFVKEGNMNLQYLEFVPKTEDKK